ncbi:MAG: hypothetical protein R2698_00690 [Microthrixaceae bacterium]
MYEPTAVVTTSTTTDTEPVATTPDEVTAAGAADADDTDEIDLTRPLQAVVPDASGGDRGIWESNGSAAATAAPPTPLLTPGPFGTPSADAPDTGGPADASWPTAEGVEDEVERDVVKPALLDSIMVPPPVFGGGTIGSTTMPPAHRADATEPPPYAPHTGGASAAGVAPFPAVGSPPEPATAPRPPSAPISPFGTVPSNFAPPFGSTAPAEAPASTPGAPIPPTPPMSPFGAPGPGPAAADVATPPSPPAVPPTLSFDEGTFAEQAGQRPPSGPPGQPVPELNLHKAAKAPKDRRSLLPILLCVLGVIVLLAGAYLLFFSGDDSSEPTPTSAKQAVVTTAPGAATTVPAPTTPPTTAASATPTPATVAPAVAAAYTAAFDAEATRACDVIKADPGQRTEAVIHFDDAWTAIGKTYEDLQRSVNDCSFDRRNEAFRRLAQIAAGG